MLSFPTFVLSGFAFVTPVSEGRVLRSPPVSPECSLFFLPGFAFNMSKSRHQTHARLGLLCASHEWATFSCADLKTRPGMSLCSAHLSREARFPARGEGALTPWKSEWAQADAATCGADPGHGRHCGSLRSLARREAIRRVTQAAKMLTWPGTKASCQQWARAHGQVSMPS